jgi:arylsulfatase A-like enzyme
MQGVSLRPGAAVTRTEFLFAELDIAGTVRSIRTRRYKLITASEGNPRDLPVLALFDLQMDPGEQKNLAQDKPETVRLLRAELDRVIAFAEAHAVAGQSRELDVDTWERLQQLGY